MTRISLGAATSVAVPPGAIQQMLVVVKGLSLTTGTPTVLQVQPRQAVNQNMSWSDEYAVQVITTSKTEIQVLVRLLDLNTGWASALTPSSLTKTPDCPVWPRRVNQGP